METLLLDPVAETELVIQDDAPLLGKKLNDQIRDSSSRVFAIVPKGQEDRNFVEKSTKMVFASQKTKLIVHYGEVTSITFSKTLWKLCRGFNETKSDAEVITDFIERVKVIREFTVLELF
jgi:hypothetical protein